MSLNSNSRAPSTRISRSIIKCQVDPKSNQTYESLQEENRSLKMENLRLRDENISLIAKLNCAELQLRASKVKNSLEEKVKPAEKVKLEVHESQIVDYDLNACENDVNQVQIPMLGQDYLSEMFGNTMPKIEPGTDLLECDVVRLWMHVHNTRLENTKKSDKIKTLVTKDVSDQIIVHWKKSMPDVSISETFVWAHLKVVIDKAKNLCKPTNSQNFDEISWIHEKQSEFARQFWDTSMIDKSRSEDKETSKESSIDAQNTDHSKNVSFVKKIKKKQNPKRKQDDLTKGEMKNLIFGNSIPALEPDKIPTQGDVIRLLISKFERKLKENEFINKATKNKIIREVSTEVIEIWPEKTPVLEYSSSKNFVWILVKKLLKDAEHLSTRSKYLVDNCWITSQRKRFEKPFPDIINFKKPDRVASFLKDDSSASDNDDLESEVEEVSTENAQNMIEEPLALTEQIFIKEESIEDHEIVLSDKR